MNLMRGIDLKKIAEKMNGASGAELKVYSICIICLVLTPNLKLYSLLKQFVVVLLNSFAFMNCYPVVIIVKMMGAFIFI